MDIFKSPYFDSEALGPIGNEQETESYNNLPSNPFLTQYFLAEDDLDELEQIDEEWMEDEFEDEWENESDDTMEMQEIEEEFYEEDESFFEENEINTELLNEEIDLFNSAKDFEEEIDFFSDNKNLKEEFFPFLKVKKPINVRRAIARNRFWSKKLKWEEHTSKIKFFLFQVFPDIQIKTEKGFALAVGKWQLITFPLEQPDGIIGPDTWRNLKPIVTKINITISPSQIPNQGINSRLKNIDELTEDIYQAEFDILKSWESGLIQFYVVMESASDAEVSKEFGSVLYNYISSQLIDTIASKMPLGKTVVELFGILKQEHERVKKARDSASLRNFIVNFSRTLREISKILISNKADYKSKVRSYYEFMNNDEKTAYKSKLISHINKLDKKRKDGWLNSSYTFKMIAFAWIRNSEYNWFKRGNRESFVTVWVKIKQDGYLDIEKAKVNAPGGKKIAEQLIKNAKNDRVLLRPYIWPVNLVISFSNDGSSFIHDNMEINYKTGTIKSLYGKAPKLFKKLSAQKLTTMNIV